MGYNTSLLILNDALHQIKEDQDFGQKVYEAALQLHNGKPVDIRSGCHVNAATAVETHHADHLVILASGGNRMENLGFVGNYRATPEEILKELAEKMGYRLIKKRKSRP